MCVKFDRFVSNFLGVPSRVLPVAMRIGILDTVVQALIPLFLDSLPWVRILKVSVVCIQCHKNSDCTVTAHGN